MKLFKKLGVVAAFAAVAGLVGGTVFYGVNAAGNYFVYNTTKSVSAAGAVSAEAKKDTTVNTLENVIQKSDASTSTTDSASTNSVADVAAQCMPTVVTIATISVKEMQSFFGGSQEYKASGAGTGVIVGQNDTELLIATNNHVVNGATSLSVGFIDQTSVEAYVKGNDAEHDLAVVAVKLSDISDETIDQISIVEIGDSDELQLGDQVVAIGNALGYGQSVTSGYVSAKGRELKLTDGTETFVSSDLIQIDAAINSGNSGGALLNMNGQLVGINEAKGSSSSSSSASVEGMGYAIPIDKALPILNELMTLPEKAAEPGYIGITCADVTEEIASSYNMPVGVCITDVVSGGPADQAGLIKGDIVTEINGIEVTSYVDLVNQLQYCEAGSTATIKYMRANDGQYVESEVSLVLATEDIISQYTNANANNSSENENNGNGFNNNPNEDSNREGNSFFDGLLD